MPQTTKITTCCYCGTRAMLRLAGSVRHELACANCGAPLHSLKWLKAPAPAASAPSHRRRSPPPKPAGHAPRPDRPRRRPGALRRLIEEVADAVEDIFD